MSKHDPAQALRKLAEVWPPDEWTAHDSSKYIWEIDGKVVAYNKPNVDELLAAIRERGWWFIEARGTLDQRYILTFQQHDSTNFVNVEAFSFFDACALALVEIIEKEGR